jgi:hypothetical protein
VNVKKKVKMVQLYSIRNYNIFYLRLQISVGVIYFRFSIFRFNDILLQAVNLISAEVYLKSLNIGLERILSFVATVGSKEVLC